MSPSETPTFQSNFTKALLVYVGYLAIVFTTWYVNDTDYMNIGKNAETVKLSFAYPTLFGSAFVLLAITYLNWWRPVLFDKTTVKPSWIWLFPLTVVVLIVLKLLKTNFNELSGELLLLTALGGVGVGIGEEIITRGSLLVGLRAKYSEGKVWLYSTLLFSALHIPNVFFGLPVEGLLLQLPFTFIMGSGLYLTRRISGTLILPIILHGLWDSSILLNQLSGESSPLWHLISHPLAIVCVVAMLYKSWNVKSA